VKTDQLLTLNEALQMSRKEVKERYKEFVNPSLANMLSLLEFDKQYVQAEGCYVWDSDGNKYLDFLGGYGALNLGHNHPRVIEAITRVTSLPNLLQASMGTLTAALASNLAAITPGKLSRTFFCNSGAEAVEGALKLARAFTGKKKLISCAHSFHGKTLGALSITGRAKYQTAFLPLVPECEIVPFGDALALEQELEKGGVAAFILEPVQGEGGIIVPPPGYLAEVRRLCSQYGVLLIADEIQTGFGRTGYMFTCDEEGVEPDIMCLAKALGGGVMPIGAYITTPDIWDKAYGTMDKCTLHTSTFGGNALACAAGIATIQVLVEEDLAAQAGEKGTYLLSALAKLKEQYPLVADVRGKGLLVGVEFTKPEGGLLNKLTGGMVSKLSEEYLGAMVAAELQNKHGIITAYTLNNPNVIRLEPPLTVSKEEIDRVLAALENIFSKNHSFLGVAVSSGKSAISSTIGGLFKRQN